MDAALDDFEQSSLPPRVKAMLAFLRKQTLEPDQIRPEDAAAVRAAGVSDEAIYEACHVALLFDAITRMADALEFALVSDAEFAESARSLLRFGYRL